jgi:hypothetical protein
LICSQFYQEDFSGGPAHLVVEQSADCAPGGYLQIKFPQNIPTTERYDFDWQVLKGQADPFQNYPY